MRQTDGAAEAPFQRLYPDVTPSGRVVDTLRGYDVSEAKQLSEDRIRARAYALWEQDGQPEGRPDNYWEQARRELEGSEDSGDEPSEALAAQPLNGP